MQFQVPQNIDLEDKIIGPLTLKQFIILLVGGMFDYIWYTFLDTSLFILLAIPTTAFTLALVFAKVHEEPFPKFLGNLILFTLKPKIMVWGQGLKPQIIEAKKIKKEKISPEKMTTKEDIQRLAQVIDTQGWGGPEIKPISPPPAPKALPIPVAKAPAQPQPKPRPPKIEAPKPPPQLIQPTISQPQPFRVATVQKQPPTQPAATKPAKPLISPKDIKKIAKEVAKKEKTSAKKAKQAAEEIAKKLKTTPPEQIKPKQPLWKKIITKIPKMPEKKTPFPAPQESTKEQILNTVITSPEDMERELGLGGRVKSHQAVRPKLNLGPASENVAEDPFDKVGK